MTADPDVLELFAPAARIADRYVLGPVLGQGGMGAVYRVLDESTGRTVALKQLRTEGRPNAVAAQMVSQFEREYHTLSQLAHPSIIEVYDYGTDSTGAFYTMELLDGPDLRERGRLHWARCVCGVARRGVLPRDHAFAPPVAPRHLGAQRRCTSSGRAKLIDFGAMAQMGVVKQLVGTAPFVSPEALQLQLLDGRSDLFALGALAYWVLTGRHSYPARSFAEPDTIADALAQAGLQPRAPPVSRPLRSAQLSLSLYQTLLPVA